MDSSMDTSSMSSSRSGGSLSLGREPPTSSDTYDGILQVTINYPRTASFLKMSSQKQKLLYIKIFNILYNAIGMNTGDYDIVFEACKSGQIHLHGWFTIQHDYRVISVLLSDIVKQFLQCLPKKYSTFKESNIYSQYNRYRSPALCLQYIDLSNDEDIQKQQNFIEYMKKSPV